MKKKFDIEKMPILNLIAAILGFLGGIYVIVSGLENLSRYWYTTGALQIGFGIVDFIFMIINVLIIIKKCEE